jgi:hypothetical protein
MTKAINELKYKEGPIGTRQFPDEPQLEKSSPSSADTPLNPLPLGSGTAADLAASPPHDLASGASFSSQLVTAGCEVLSALRARGITVRLNGDGRPQVGPAELVDEADLALLRGHRDAAIAALASEASEGSRSLSGVLRGSEGDSAAAAPFQDRCPRCRRADYEPLPEHGARCRRCGALYQRTRAEEPDCESKAESAA